ncbi:MAG: DUF342 domain-containing protein [Candidatus Cloacimonetes bacterium]|nr:DUF342 domain-containing protein [Candidatus Cloacimonadota bacterium]
MRDLQRFSNAAETVVLEVDKDGFSAYLTIAETADFINEKEILTLLNLAGIKHGIERAEIKRREEGLPKEAGKPFLVAFAENSLPRISFDFVVPHGTFLPSIIDDINSLNDATFVQNQQHIATVVIEECADSAYNIFGEEIDASFATRTQLKTLVGKNISYDETNNQLFATAAGYLGKTDEGALFVQDAVELHATLRNCEASCKTSFHITGDVIESRLTIDGSLTVDGLIQNCGGEGILALGSISFRNCENSTILAGGHINIQEAVIGCKMVAEKGVKGSEESLIIGGYTSSGGDISVGILGSREKDTDVEIAVKPFIKEYFRRYDNPPYQRFIKLYQAALSQCFEEDCIFPTVKINTSINGRCRIRKQGIVYRYLDSETAVIL